MLGTSLGGAERAAVHAAGSAGAAGVRGESIANNGVLGLIPGTVTRARPLLQFPLPLAVTRLRTSEPGRYKIVAADRAQAVGS